MSARTKLDLEGFLTVLFVTYNSSDVIAAGLQSCAAQLEGAELVVVDNGSTDETVDVAHRAGARVISGHGNVGFGAGVNLGIRAATTPFVLVVNPDARVVALESWLVEQFLVEGPFGVLAASERRGGRLRPLLETVYVWPIDLAISMAYWFLVPAEVDLKRPRLPGLRRRFSGAAFVVRSDEFLLLGGFDERLFLYHEDEDLSRRYSAAKLPVRSSSGLIVEHDQGGSSPRNHERILAWQLLSFVQMIDSLRGDRAAQRSARSVLIGLRAIKALGKAVGRWPWIGRRALDKARSAGAVEAQLRVASDHPPTPVAYPQAAPVFRRLLRRVPADR